METKTKIFGMPLFSAGFVANGFIAIGFAGRGVITIAQFGYGIIAVTQFGFGIISISQFGFGIISAGQGVLGLLFALGQWALGFIAVGLSSAGYYSISAPKNIRDTIPLLFDTITGDPVPLAVWCAFLAVMFIFLRSQRDKFTLRMSITDLFRSRKKHRDDQIRARAVSKMSDQSELIDIALNDPSDTVKLAALRNITDQGALIKIALATRSDEAAGFLINAIKDQEALFDIAQNAVLPRMKIFAVDNLKPADPARLVKLACAENNSQVIEKIVDRISDRAGLETVIRKASSPHARIIGLYNLKEPDQDFLLGIVRDEKDTAVCKSAIYQMRDPEMLIKIIRGNYPPALKITAVEQIEDKQVLVELSKSDAEEAVKEAVSHRIDEIRPVYYALKIEVACPFCSQPIFVNGPMKKITCQLCLRESAITGALWDGILGAGIGISRFPASMNMVVEKSRNTPSCGKCEATLQTDDVPKGSKKQIQCPSCRELHSTFPLPGGIKWPKHAEQVFCAEEDGARAPGTRDIKPVAISCIKCGAPLEITVDTPRNATCAYCNTVQYLPDPLWLSLHPVKIKQAWYIRYSYREREQQSAPVQA